jgi:hypothetical protein
MRREDLVDLDAFLTVAEEKRFTRAAAMRARLACNSRAPHLEPPGEDHYQPRRRDLGSQSQLSIV